MFKGIWRFLLLSCEVRVSLHANKDISGPVLLKQLVNGLQIRVYEWRSTAPCCNVFRMDRGWS